MFKKRIGPDPHANNAATPGLRGCPDIWELTNGDIAVIGRDITKDAVCQLPAGVTCGPDERIVVIPRKTIAAAKRDMPDRQ